MKSEPRSVVNIDIDFCCNFFFCYLFTRTSFFFSLDLLSKNRRQISIQMLGQLNAHFESPLENIIRYGMTSEGYAYLSSHLLGLHQRKKHLSILTGYSIESSR